MINRYNIGGNGCNQYNDILADFKDLKVAYEKCQKFSEKIVQQLELKEIYGIKVKQ